MGSTPKVNHGRSQEPQPFSLRWTRRRNQAQNRPRKCEPEPVRQRILLLHTGRGTMSAIVEIQGLSKQYGRRKAVDDVNMTIESGEIFGLVGPNGAGKTTTMRMLVTLLRPDKGEIRVGGYSVRKSPR